jgi:hypothetical protein
VFGGTVCVVPAAAAAGGGFSDHHLCKQQLHALRQLLLQFGCFQPLKQPAAAAAAVAGLLLLQQGGCLGSVNHTQQGGLAGACKGSRQVVAVCEFQRCV